MHVTPPDYTILKFKKWLKTSKGQSEAVSRKTCNVKGKGTKEQTMIYKTSQRKQMIQKHEPLKNRWRTQAFLPGLANMLPVQIYNFTICFEAQSL